MLRRLYQFHSWMGLIAGLGLLVVGVTGSIVVFQDELDQILIPEFVKNPHPDAPRLEPDEFIAAFSRNMPGFEPMVWWRTHDATWTDMVYAVRHGERGGSKMYVDPTTGKPVSGFLGESGTFTSWMILFHFTLSACTTGIVLTGFFAVLLCLLGVSGARLHRGFWRHFFRLRWRLSARIFFSDLHKMTGITSTVFNLILGFTGAAWNISTVKETILGRNDPPPPVINGRAWSQTISLDALRAQAEKLLPRFHMIEIQFPHERGGHIGLYGHVTDKGPVRSDYGWGVEFDAETGRPAAIQDICTESVWNQFWDTFRPLHYGTFGGLPIKILWCLGGLAPGILAVSGSCLWWRRKRPRKKSHTASGGPIPVLSQS